MRKKGFKHSKETREKIGKANKISVKRFYDNGGTSWNKGKKLPELSEKYKEKGNPMYGKKAWNNGIKIDRKKYPTMGHFNLHTEKTKEYLSKISKGQHRSPDTEFKKGRKGLKGENSPSWNPNREEMRKNLRNDAEYLQWVIKVKKRDKGQCRLKNKDCSGYNIVHHIRDWKNYPELRYKLTNGITLCQAHHPRKRAEEKRLVPILEGLVSVSS